MLSEAITNIALSGVWKRGSTLARLRGNSPARAIATSNRTAIMNIPFQAFNKETAVAHNSPTVSMRPYGAALAAAAAGSDAESDALHGIAMLALMMTIQ